MDPHSHNDKNGLELNRDCLLHKEPHPSSLSQVFLALHTIQVHFLGAGGISMGDLTSRQKYDEFQIQSMELLLGNHELNSLPSSVLVYLKPEHPCRFHTIEK